MRAFQAAVVVLLSATLSAAQIFSSTSAKATSSAILTTGQPCAVVSSLLASTIANPSATNAPYVPAELAYECANSAPLVPQDATDLIDGLTAFLQWQSTLTYLKNPPEGYPLAGVDILGGMQQLRNNVGSFKSEIEFQTNLTNLIGQAHDGHLTFQADALNVFTYFRAAIGDLVSISVNGSLPQIYSYIDLLTEATGSITWTPSPVTSIDGQKATDWLTHLAENTTIGFQDPDALYNSLFYEIASSAGLFSGMAQSYTGPNTTLGFQNGTTQTYPNIAATNLDFTGVNSGETFYATFCNATNKMNLAGPAGTTNSTQFSIHQHSKRQLSPTQTLANPTATATPTSVMQAAYPNPVVSSSDGTIAGYFLTDGEFNSTAVLSIIQESEGDPLGAQQTLTQFLDACRKASMTYLIIDVQQNGGGTIVLAYDFFKQLFPTVEPYAASNKRAQPQYNALGSVITPEADQALQQSPSNLTNFETYGGYSEYDATVYLNESGQAFTSWDAFYGPVDLHDDTFTNILRLNISDPNYDEFASGNGIVISGYGNASHLAPQPFLPQNMILFTDGQCSSSCTTLAHLLKWQGKVKSIVAGGRPTPGPMQSIGGVKGKQVYTLAGLYSDLLTFTPNFSPAQLAAVNGTDLKTFAQLANYVQFRTPDPTNPASGEISINLQNSIAEGDTTTTPLQFVYEAADCRIWWTPDMLLDITAIWQTVAMQAFGLKGTKVFSGCVAGSTNQPSSLSGDAQLFGDGKPSNVTVFVNQQVTNGTGTDGASSSAGGASKTSGAPKGSSTAKGSAAPSRGLVSHGLLGMVMVTALLALST